MYESYINKIEDVGKLRNLKPKTITLYQKNVSRFLNYIQKNPEELTCEDARNYLLHLQGKGDKASTLNNNNGSLVFFYKRVLGKLWDDNLVPRAINDYAVPEVLSFHDVEKLLNATEDLKYKAIFAIMYSSGLRISEVLHLHYEDISRKNMQIYIRDSKTHTARYALLSKRARTRSIASTSKIKSRLTAALVINSFESRPADLVTTVTDHPERTGRYHPYVSESLLRDIRSNHTVLGCLPLLFPQCCR